MLQRIQTIYLFLSSILLVLMLFMPIMDFNSGEYAFNTLKITQLPETDANYSLTAIPIFILISISTVITIFSIFLFKKRPLQMRFTVFSIILLVSFYLMIAYYRFIAIDFEIVSTSYSIGLIIPLIASILNFMANRRIKKDEDLVKSADRIR